MALAACGDAPPAAAPAPIPLSAEGLALPSEHTLRSQAQHREVVAGFDARDAAEAARGLMAPAPGGQIKDGRGDVVWDHDAYAFLTGDAPPTVNPSLWRHAQLSAVSGLFQVAEGVYQVRGFDIANMTLLRGATGWIVVDPLTCTETARAALTFAFEHLGAAPITAVIYSHNHMDHFGGVQGILRAPPGEDDDPAELAPGDPAQLPQSGLGVPIYAPPDFLEEATRENMLIGQGMGRRSELMYGRDLPRGPWGHVNGGMGKALAFGTQGILPPTEPPPVSGARTVIDGVELVFLDVSGSEAPSEFVFYLPKVRALFAAELVSRTLHNLYTLRGAKVRDATLWAQRIAEARAAFPEAEVAFGGHLWPMWGRERIQAWMDEQGDLYRFIHDQTLRMANGGLTANEIAEALALPPEVAAHAESRGYYGTVSHNAKSVYQRYYGWYDANPAHLQPLPETEAATRYVEMMGGAEGVMTGARAAYDRGEYRWVAEILNHLVFADPDHEGARALLAASYEQLGYVAESAAWRDVYLSAARTLRGGEGSGGMSLRRSAQLLRYTPLSIVLESMSTRAKAHRMERKKLVIDVTFQEVGETHRIWAQGGVLRHRPLVGGARVGEGEADAAITVDYPLFLNLVTGEAGALEVIRGDDFDVEGDRIALLRFFALFRIPDMGFDIVTP